MVHTLNSLFFPGDSVQDRAATYPKSALQIRPMLDGFSTLTDAFAASVPRHPQPRSVETPQKTKMPRLVNIWQSQSIFQRKITAASNESSSSPSVRILEPVNASSLIDSHTTQPTVLQSLNPQTDYVSSHPEAESHMVVRLSPGFHMNHNLVPAVLLSILLLLLVCGHILYSLRLRRKRQNENTRAVAEKRDLLDDRGSASV